MSEIKAVVFDIDGTLTTRVSWNYLVDELGGSHEAERQNYLNYRNGLINQVQTDENVLALWNATGKANKDEFVRIFRSMPLRDDAQGVVDYLKSKNIILCLITGAMDLYAQITAQRLGIENYYANTILHWNEDNSIKNYDYTEDQSAKKVEQFLEFCQKYNLQPEDCAAVGDSFNDFGLFALTKKGIAIRSEFEDDAIEKVAWKKVKTLSEIKDLIK